MSMDDLQKKQDCLSIWRNLKGQRENFLQMRDAIKKNIDDIKKIMCISSGIQR